MTNDTATPLFDAEGTLLEGPALLAELRRLRDFHYKEASKHYRLGGEWGERVKAEERRQEPKVPVDEVVVGDLGTTP
jgi:hypothetical protein